ncbi:MAG: SPOR domain-containing protein [Pseudomonadota bacterium]
MSKARGIRTVRQASIGAKAPVFYIRTFGVLAATALLAGCQASDLFSGAKSSGTGSEATRAATAASGVQRIDRDIEAPEVYAATDQALWDGRPSFGGVWIAAPDVTSPERVLMRNTENGKTVVGALFKRERDNPGPVMQLSSEAAVALGVLAGAPTEIAVVALRQEEAEEPTVPAAVLPADVAPVEEGEVLLSEEAAAPAALPEVSSTPLDGAEATDVLAAATAAVEAAEAAPAPRVEVADVIPTAAVTASDVPAPAAPAPVPAPVVEDTGPLAEPYIQVGLFSLEANAMETAGQLSKAGLLSTILSQNSGDQQAWRVVVGPAETRADRAAFIRKAWDLGFIDAYPVEG